MSKCRKVEWSAFGAGNSAKEIFVVLASVSDASF